MDDLKRQLSLKVHFKKPNEEQNNTYKSTILDKIIRRDRKNPWQPPHENCISAYTDAIKDEIQNSRPQCPRPNITKNEYEALIKLSNRTDIVIKKADKGSATVVCSSDWYENEALRQLSDTSFYKKVEVNNTKKHENIITNALEQFSTKNLINKETLKKLVPTNSRTPEFYMLPKIHKSPVTGRPVISSTGCHSEKISAFVDEKLRPAVSELPSYIKDSDDFLQKIQKLHSVGKDDYLVTLDVSSLYTNIDNEEGVKAIEENPSIREKYTNEFIQMICKLMTLVLTLNNFIFNGQNYQQVKGTAMGTRAAPNYANLYMGQFEDKHIYQTSWNQHIKFYGRFIDDICLIWQGTEPQLKSFLKHLNEVHPSIKFTFEYSKHKINFLDITLIKNATGELSTDIFQKTTDTHSYLLRSSAHPNHSLKSIPYSQLLRIKRLVSDPVKLKHRISEFIEYFVCSGYSRKLLKKTAEHVMGTTVSEKRNREIESTPRFITTFNPKYTNIRDTIGKHWSITQTNSRCRDALKDSPKIAYKRGKNLSDILVRSKYVRGNPPGRRNMIGGVTKCGKTICSWCSKIVEGPKFSSLVTGKEFVILHELTCNSPWVVYLCECRVHKLQYVGKSEAPLNIRFNNNRNHLKQSNPACKLVQHFKTSVTCNFEKDLRLMPIEQISMKDDSTTSPEYKKKVLRRREIHWQNVLRTFKPEGMNKREG